MGVESAAASAPPAILAYAGALATLAIMLTSLAGQARQPPTRDPPPPDAVHLLTDQERILRLQRVEPRRSTPGQVRQLIGPPDHIARQILYNRAREQWLYDLPFFVRLEFEYPRGQDPQLLSVQPTSSTRP